MYFTVYFASSRRRCSRGVLSHFMGASKLAQASGFWTPYFGGPFPSQASTPSLTIPITCTASQQRFSCISLTFGDCSHKNMTTKILCAPSPNTATRGALAVMGGYKGYNWVYYKHHKCTSSILTDSHAPNTRFRVRTRSGRWWSVGGSAVVSMWVFGVHKHQGRLLPHPHPITTRITPHSSLLSPSRPIPIPL